MNDKEYCLRLIRHTAILIWEDIREIMVNFSCTDDYVSATQNICEKMKLAEDLQQQYYHLFNTGTCDISQEQFNEIKKRNNIDESKFILKTGCK